MTESRAFKRSFLWGRWVLRWVGEAGLLWLALGVVVAALFLAFYGGASEPRIRITGLALQVLGLATVIWGIREAGQLFGKPTLLMALSAWLSRFPSSCQPRIVGLVGTSSAVATTSARGSVRAGLPPDASIEKRIEVLERNLGYVSEEVEQLHTELDRARSEMLRNLKDEALQRNESDEKLHRQLEAAHTEGLYIATVGTLWLFVGVCMSTASVEIFRVAN